jgi:hypothetical protein
VPYRGKPAGECRDTPRYKATGNSMAVPVMRWIGEGIALVETIRKEKMNREEYCAERIARLSDPKQPSYCSFNNHVADLTKQGEITVIDWHNRDGSNAYHVRYVFDFDKLYISGDLGSAIFQWCGSRIDPLKYLSKDYYYLTSKMQCTSETDCINNEVFRADFDEWKESYVGTDYDIADCVEEIEFAHSEACSYDAAEYAQLIWSNSTISDALGDWEAMGIVASFGRAYNPRFIYWFEGLRMAQKQLRDADSKQLPDWEEI